MAFPEKFLAELVERNDIVSVVSEYVRLDKRSGVNIFGLCPFHSEKTASFSVNADRQIYHCFGCGKGGGVINFVMDIENLSYPEAVEFLAKRAGMQLPEEVDNAEHRKRARMLALNKDAARFFHEQLSTSAGETARAYISKRGISPAMVKNFGLGAAPDTWDTMRDALREKGYTEHELYEAGLVRRGKNGGFYDAFRNRLMFPIIDVRGNVIGFSGRILGDGEPKYYNSPETAVFSKSRNLFGMNLAKKSKSGHIILVEGNIDVVSLHQAGFDCAVASLGTSLTQEQARLISRFTNEVILAYDSDGAGVSASQRAINVLGKLDVKVRVLKLEGAKDPDEFIKAKGTEAFRKLLSGSENQMDYRLGVIQDKYDLSRDEQKVEFLKEACELLAGQPDATGRQVYAMRIARLIGLSESAVIDDVERRHKKRVNAYSRQEQKKQTRPEQQLQPAAKSLHYEDPASAAAEEGIIRLLYNDPELIKNNNLPDASDFSSATLRKIYSLLLGKIQRAEHISPDTLAEELSSEEMSLLVSLLQKPEIFSRSRQSMTDYIAKIEERKELRAGTLDLRALSEKMRQTKGYGGQQ